MTTLRPAFETTLVHGDHAVTLRASLRAAVAIDHLDGGFPAVLDRLAQGHLTTVKATIRASATDRQQAEQFLTGLDGKPLRPFLDEAAPACVALVAAILPGDDDDKPKASTTTGTETTGKPWSDYFGDLFAHACGWMGWTPTETWNASPDEIATAFAAHVDRLIAMNGGADKDEPADAAAKEAQRQANIEAGLDPDFDRAALRALQARMS